MIHHKIKAFDGRRGRQKWGSPWPFGRRSRRTPSRFVPVGTTMPKPDASQHTGPATGDGPAFADFLDRIRAGDEWAASELVRRYEPALRMEIKLRLNDRKLRRLLEPGDICQSVLKSFFLRAATGQFDIDSPEKLAGLLRAMAHNKVADQVREQQALRRDHRRSVSLNQGEFPIAAADPSPSRTAMGREELAAFRGRLSVEERRLADLRRSAGSGAKSPESSAAHPRPGASSSRVLLIGLLRNLDSSRRPMKPSDSYRAPLESPHDVAREPHELLEELWNRGERPDVRTFLTRFQDEELAVDDILAVIRVDQRRRWTAGDRVGVDFYRRDFPAIDRDPEAFFELIYNEYLVREELGENVDSNQYLSAFPCLPSACEFNLKFTPRSQAAVS